MDTFYDNVIVPILMGLLGAMILVLIGGVTPGGPAEKAGLKEGDLIIEIGGKPVKNIGGYMTAMAGQKVGQVVAGGVAFHVGAEGEDDFLHRLGAETRFQFRDPQVLRADAVERRDLPAQHMKAPVERAGLLDAENVRGPLHHAD